MNLLSLDPTLKRDEETNPDSTFEFCSDRMQRLFPTNQIDAMSKFMQSTDNETVSFAGLKALLLCKDMDKYAFLN